MSGARKVHIRSFGCQMNVYDSHRMADTLAGEGYAETAAVGDADLIILNTCHIREKAADKVYSELGRLRRLKEAAAVEDRRVVVVVAGCVAQAPAGSGGGQVAQRPFHFGAKAAKTGRPRRGSCGEVEFSIPAKG